MSVGSNSQCVHYLGDLQLAVLTEDIIDFGVSDIQPGVAHVERTEKQDLNRTGHIIGSYP